MIQLKQTTLLLLTAFVAACLALLPRAQAVSPPPDGGYAGANTAEGDYALLSLTNGTGNTANGFASLSLNTSGYNNTAIGEYSLDLNTSGHDNTANGVLALDSNTTASNNTATGSHALELNTTGGNNTATGSHALELNTTGGNNTANGYAALYSNTTGSYNTVAGFDALLVNTAGGGNTAIGAFGLSGNTTGSYNTAIGALALYSNTSGNSNVALGFLAGSSLTTGDNNIDIGNLGVAAESTTIRIGAQGVQTATYIAGIFGTTSAGSLVGVDSTGHLGVLATSSARFKDDTKSMDKASEAILALKPVTFRYKKEIDSKGIPQFGLVAEQVEKVNPDLVTRDAEGKLYTVRYDAINAMLLNEFLKEHREVQEQKTTIAELKSGMAQQQKQIAALTVGLQRVSAQLELSKSAPQTVNLK
jgi:hypothetical protein